MLDTFPEKLTPNTIVRDEDATHAEIEDCGLYVDDLELLETIEAIETGRPFLVHDQALMSTGRDAKGAIVAISIDRTIGRISIRRRELSITLIYARLCENAISFPWRCASEINRRTCRSEARAA